MVSELNPRPVSQGLGTEATNEHATDCASDECLVCLVASGHGVAKVHLPLFCGRLYSSASGMEVCSLALLLGAHLVFEL